VGNPRAARHQRARAEAAHLAGHRAEPARQGAGHPRAGDR